MLTDVKEYCNEINELLQELETYENYKEQIDNDLKELEKKYLAKKYNYKEYSELKSRLLEGKTKKGLFDYYNSYILSLIKKIDFLNTQIFSEVYAGKAVAEKVAKEIMEQPSFKPAETEKRVEEKEELIKFKSILTKTKVKDIGREREEKGIEVKIPKLDKEIETRPEPEISSIVKQEKPMELRTETLAQGEIPRPLPRRKLRVPTPKVGLLKRLVTPTKKKSLFEELQEEEQIKPVKPISLKIGGILNLDIIKNVRRRIKERSEFLGEETELSPTIMRLGTVGEEEELKAGVSPTLMTKQAERIRNILLQKKVKIYSPSSLGFLSNIVVRRMVLALMKKYPNFFKQIYFSLRYANVKILSNTYVNIMFFVTLTTFLVVFPISLILFSFQGTPFLLNVVKALLFGVILSGATFAYFYLSPNSKIKKRIRSINTNLPFAIDHMSSVASSGVPPSTMFKLIAESKEYGEVSVEIEKISNYIEIFGYDMVTAMRSVASISPSKQLKEFFDGFISTVESGGDLKNYLSQKSKEALLSYRLERQKYVESVSTYSDIYTGVLIAAPLFFVSTLSLVSMLGGDVGGLAVGTIIAIGTYIVIPVLNVLFIVFLEMNQPQI